MPKIHVYTGAFIAVLFGRSG